MVTDLPISDEPGVVPTEVPSPSACTDFHGSIETLMSQPREQHQEKIVTVILISF